MTPEIPDSPLSATAQELRAARQAFAIATVVRTVGSTAAKPGARALVLADGTIVEGWIGGGCVRGAIGRAAIEALADGTPRFISLQPQDMLAERGIAPGADLDGVHFARNGCPSAGSKDIIVEPVLPQPELVVSGASPVARARAALAGQFGFDIRTQESAGPLPPLGKAVRRMIVVATQGKGDLDGLTTALESEAEYIGFVGSRRKFAALAAKLRDQGLGDNALGRVHSPAGLAIEAVTPDEIALSILAQLIQTRRSGQRRAHAGGNDG